MRAAGIRHLATVLLLTALLGRGLVPAGWMPSDSGGRPGLVICSIDGMHRVAPEHRRPHHPDGRSDNTVCPFAAAAPLCTPPAHPVAQVPAAFPIYAVFGFGQAEVVKAVIHGVNLARAPPAFG